MKAQMPRFLTRILTLRRKYEVDESKWLVQWGRPKVRWLIKNGLPIAKTLMHDGQIVLIHGLAEGKLIVRQGPKLAEIGRAGGRRFAHQGRKIAWFFQWRRIPKEWEISFVVKMKSMEARGIPFQQVLKTNLPMLFGDGPSEVLLRWMGRKNRTQPKRFAKAAAKMFGKSAKSIITGLENLADPDKMLEVHQEVEPPFQSLIEAIQRADDLKAELPNE